MMLRADGSGQEMKHYSHLNTAVRLIEQYRDELPFSIFLKSFFAQHKKYGSKDRKSISHLCYSYFRLGHAMPSFSIEEKILVALFLCDRQPTELLQRLKPEWSKQIQLSIYDKIDMLHGQNISFSIKDIFPWKDLLSEGVDHEQFCRSFLIQPDLFLRLRPGHEKRVKQKLRNAGIDFNEVSANCLSLPNASKIDAVIELDREVVVQDLNSQKTGAFLTSNFPGSKAGIQPPAVADHAASKAPTLGQTLPQAKPTSDISVWDCCAASGGKSILAYDLIPNNRLTVSDIRESIISNLKKRFARAGIKNYQAFVIDLANAAPDIKKFDLIICDAPCTGSGTWSRTPEQVVFFNHQSGINHYAALQRKIAGNAIPLLKKGGRFVYITCSVFKKENEEAVQFIVDNFSLQLERMEILKGYDKKADTLFAASFIVNE